VLAVPLGRMRRQLGLRKSTGGIGKSALIFAEFKVHFMSPFCSTRLLAPDGFAAQSGGPWCSQRLSTASRAVICCTRQPW
jgi:hypothetical protein